MTLKSAAAKMREMILLGECPSNGIRLELPLPPPELFPNRAAGKHWAVLYKHKQSFKESCYLLTKSQTKTPFKGGSMTIMFCFKTAQNRDVDNCLAAAKSGLDGMAQALDLNDRYLDPVLVFREYKREPKMIIILENL